jgi:hypothetical protein
MNNNDLDENGFRYTRKDKRMPKAAVRWREQCERHRPRCRQYGRGYYHGKKGTPIPVDASEHFRNGYRAGIRAR